MRWKRRALDGQAPVGKRGPKKVQPLNLSELKEKIEALDHGSKRSRAVGRLHRAYGESISRRELNALVRQVREEINRRRCDEMCRVTWLHSNLAWAMDDCKKSDGATGGNLNHAAVDDVLEKALVIPINSPPYRASYNGAIEHAQGEFKSYLGRWNWKGQSVDHLVLLAEIAAHDLNHQPRRCLDG